VTAALVSMGVTVKDCGLASTPAMFMITITVDDAMNCDGAIQITASHHPWFRNGLKFFTPGGGLEGEDIAALLELAQGGKFSAAPGGTAENVDYMSAYAAGLRQMITDACGENPLAGLHIIVDAGNGVGGFYATQVLAPLGADIAGSQFLDPDGRFPNHIPNPENGDAMASVCAAVTAAGADLGVIFDTDVDRAGLVDGAGREINRNRLIAMAAALALETCPGGTIVTDSVTSDGLKLFIESLGGHHRRYKRGYKNVIDEAIRLNRAGIPSPLAMETSGHAAFRENRFLDDGAYLATKLIIKAAQLKRQGKTLDSLIENLKEPAESLEFRFSIIDPDFRAVGERVLEDFKQTAARKGWPLAPDNDTSEGVRLSFDEGWLLLRVSVHDPVMPLNIESDKEGGCGEMIERVQRFFEEQAALVMPEGF